MHTGSLITNVRIMLKTVEELEIYQKYTARFSLLIKRFTNYSVYLTHGHIQRGGGLWSHAPNPKENNHSLNGRSGSVNGDLQLIHQLWTSGKIDEI